MSFSQCARFAACFSLFFSGFTLETLNADTLSTWNGGIGTWSTASQWTPVGVPTNTSGHRYTVSIGTGIVGLDVSPVINSLAIGGVLTTDYATRPASIRP